jgi:predicted nuclease of predicted toxin-antitoxin system
VKLLFDENLSPDLAKRLSDIFPGSSHVHLCDLGSADDARVWAYARANGFCLVSQDTDFRIRSELEGAPPKVIWINAGNCPTAEIDSILRRECTTIHTFEQELDATVLVLR